MEKKQKPAVPSKHSEKQLDRTEKARRTFYRGRTLLNTFFARPRPIHLLMALLFLVFGLALVTQVRAQQSDPLESLSEAELVELLAELDSRAATLEQQTDELTTQLRELNSEADQIASAYEASQKRQIQAQIAGGLIPVEGPGIVMGVADSGGNLSSQLFVMAMAELRNAGAEAIEVGGVRLTPRSWFGEQNGHLVVDGIALESPYTWRVIGDPDTLSSGIEIRGGAAYQMRLVGATVTINRRDALEIESVASQFSPTWAQVSD